MELQVSFAGNAYLERHQFKQLLAAWVERIANDMPPDPLVMLVELVNAHREGQGAMMTCENPWCEMKLPKSEYEHHKKTCRPDRWTKCIRCDMRVEISRMHQHRMNCHLVSCTHCGEFVFPRMLSLCPIGLLRQVQRKRFGQSNSTAMTLDPSGRAKQFVSSGFSGSHSPGGATPVQSRRAGALRALQSLFRRRHARTKFNQLAFQVIWGLMEFAREVKVAHGKNNIQLLTAIGSSNNLKDRERENSFTADNQRKLSLFSTSAGDIAAGAHISDVERISNEYTAEFRADVFKMIDNRDVVDFPIAHKIVNDTCKILSLRPVVVYTETPSDGEVVVIGDIHGQLKDLIHIFSTQGFPSPQKHFIFNGDFVDRGPYGMEVVLYIYTLLCSFPNYVFLNRGNHEDFKTNCEYGFQEEVLSKYEDFATEMMDSLMRSFKLLPLITVIDRRVAVLHGGVPRKTVSLERIGLIGKVKDVPTVEQVDEDDEILCDVLWSDPVERYKSRSLGMRHQGEHWRTSSRGCGIEYLHPHTQAFLELNNLEMIVRSHEMVAGGYEMCHHGHCVTVFSASDYCGVSGNRAAIAVFSAMRDDPVYYTWFIKQDVADELDLESSFNKFATNLGGQDAALTSSFDEEAAAEVPSNQKDIISVQSDCLQQVRELVWLKRYDLLSNFNAVDAEQTGMVSKVEWCEVVRKVFELDLPWYFICPFVAEVFVFRGIPCVKYAEFISSVDSTCGQSFVKGWLEATIKEVFGPMELPDDLKPGHMEHDRLQKKRMSMINESIHVNATSGAVATAAQPLPVAAPVAPAKDNTESAGTTSPPSLPHHSSSGITSRTMGSSAQTNSVPSPTTPLHHNPVLGHDACNHDNAANSWQQPSSHMGTPPIPAPPDFPRVGETSSKLRHISNDVSDTLLVNNKVAGAGSLRKDSFGLADVQTSDWVDDVVDDGALVTAKVNTMFRSNSKGHVDRRDSSGESCSSPVALAPQSSSSCVAGSSGTKGGQSSSSATFEWESFRLSFNYFVALLRAKSPTAAQFEDNDLYVLFRYFDFDSDGHLMLGELIDMIRMTVDDNDDAFSSAGSPSTQSLGSPLDERRQSSPKGSHSTGFTITKGQVAQEKWMYPSVVMLQRFFLQDRHRDLRVMFRFMDRDKDGVINFADFERAAKKMNRIISKPIEDPQIKVMFDLLSGSQEHIELQTFLEYFAVKTVEKHRNSTASRGSTGSALISASIPLSHLRGASQPFGVGNSGASSALSPADRNDPCSNSLSLGGDQPHAVSSIPFPTNRDREPDDFEIHSPSASAELSPKVEIASCPLEIGDAGLAVAIPSAYVTKKKNEVEEAGALMGATSQPN